MEIFGFQQGQDGMAAETDLHVHHGSYLTGPIIALFSKLNTIKLRLALRSRPLRSRRGWGSLSGRILATPVLAPCHSALLDVLCFSHNRRNVLVVHGLVVFG